MRFASTCVRVAGLTEFHKTCEFEPMIAHYTGASHCIVTNNGSISLTLAALSTDVSRNFSTSKSLSS